jgi:hypothetical protein
MSTQLKPEAQLIIASAYNHACEKMPDLDRESFLNGFLYGLKLASTFPGQAQDIDVRSLYEVEN